MLKRLLVLAISSVFATASAMPTPATTPAPEAAPVVPLLWKVSDADNSIYLLGSFHLLRADDRPITADVEAAFANAESLMFEVQPEQLTDPATAAKFQGAMLYTDGRTLSKALPAATLGRLEALLAATKTPVAALDPLEPWAVSLTLAVGVMQSMGFTSDHGVDKVLMARAAEAKKPVAGLESIDDQIRALDGAPEAEQVAALDEFVADPKTSVQELTRLHAAWRAGDAATLDSEFRAQMARETPESYRMVNVERNQRWVPQLEARLKASGSDDTLAVVGALHLLGDDGLVARLRAKGYSVERIGVPAGSTAGAAR